MARIAPAVVLLLFVFANCSFGQGPKFKPVDFEGEFDEHVEDDFEESLVNSKVPSSKAAEHKLQDGRKIESSYDEDEFVGFKATAEERSKLGSTETDNTPLASAPQAKIEPVRTYYLELIYVLLFMAYGVNYLLGRRTNEQIATAWITQFSQLFEQHFSKVGNDGALLSKESQSSYTLSATGRRNCLGLQATLELRKRHDLLSLFVGMFSTAEDMLIVEIPMHSQMEPFVFAVVQEKNAKKYQSEHPDLSLYAAPVESHILPVGLTILTDCKELIPLLLHSDVVATITKYQTYFAGLHFSDQAKTQKHKKLLRFMFRLPPKDQLTELKTLLRMSLHFVDLVARTQLSQQAKARAEKKRLKAAEAAHKASHAQRQEAAQQRKLAKLQEEKKKAQALPEEQQRKRELKEQKRAMKKRHPKVKVVFG